MSKLFLRQLRSIELVLLSSLGVIVGAIGLTELQPATAELGCPKNSWVYQGQLRLARDELKNAEIQRNRMRRLQADGAISQLELENAEAYYQLRLLQVKNLLQSSSTHLPAIRSAQLAAAEAEMELARTKLDRYQILFREGAISKLAMLGVEQEYRQAVKRRDELRQPGAEVRTEPRSPSACDQPPPAPKTEDSQIRQSAWPSSSPSVPSSQVGK